MERHPEDLAEDPELREEFLAQTSWDEYIERKIAEIEAEGHPETAQQLRDDAEHRHPIFQFWNHLWRREVIHPETTVNEMYYLSGYTEKPRRMAAIHQKHAELREAAQAKGWYKIPSIEGVEEFNLGEGE